MLRCIMLLQMHLAKKRFGCGAELTQNRVLLLAHGNSPHCSSRPDMVCRAWERTEETPGDQQTERPSRQEKKNSHYESVNDRSHMISEKFGEVQRCHFCKTKQLAKSGGSACAPLHCEKPVLFS